MSGSRLPRPDRRPETAPVSGLSGPGHGRAGARHGVQDLDGVSGTPARARASARHGVLDAAACDWSPFLDTDPYDAINYAETVESDAHAVLALVRQADTTADSSTPAKCARARVMGSSPATAADEAPDTTLVSGVVAPDSPTTKGARPRCGARCRSRAGAPCRAPVVVDRDDQGRPRVRRRCRMHGGLSTGPKTPEGRARIAEAQRRRRKRGLPPNLLP